MGKSAELIRTIDPNFWLSSASSQKDSLEEELSEWDKSSAHKLTIVTVLNTPVVPAGKFFLEQDQMDEVLSRIAKERSKLDEMEVHESKNSSGKPKKNPVNARIEKLVKEALASDTSTSAKQPGSGTPPSGRGFYFALLDSEHTEDIFGKKYYQLLTAMKNLEFKNEDEASRAKELRRLKPNRVVLQDASKTLIKGFDPRWKMETMHKKLLDYPEALGIIRAKMGTSVGRNDHGDDAKNVDADSDVVMAEAGNDTRTKVPKRVHLGKRKRT